ncbi:hypothetical protein HDU84_000656 [Entophlyctis sp. JEL0112]|nr:hypothetical protein HDU84_000656 [Entophlyctis sp. JEL0112]
MFLVVVALFLAAAACICAETSTAITAESVPNPFNASTATSACGLPAAVNSSDPSPVCLCNPDSILSQSTVSLLQLSLLNFTSIYSDTVCVLAVQKIQSASTTATSDEAAAFAESVRKIWAEDGGFNEPRSVLVFLDIVDRQLYISTGADARQNLSDSTATSIAESVVSDLQAAQYDQAALSLVSSVQANLVQPQSSSPSGTYSNLVGLAIWLGIVFGPCCLIGCCVLALGGCSSASGNSYSSTDSYGSYDSYGGCASGGDGGGGGSW